MWHYFDDLDYASANSHHAKSWTKGIRKTDVRDGPATEKGTTAPGRAVEESVRDNEVAGFEGFGETAACRNGNQPFHAQFLEPVNVGLIRNFGWKQAVTFTMAREERDAITVQGSCRSKHVNRHSILQVIPGSSSATYDEYVLTKCVRVTWLAIWSQCWVPFGLVLKSFNGVHATPTDHTNQTFFGCSSRWLGQCWSRRWGCLWLTERVAITLLSIISPMICYIWPSIKHCIPSWR